MENDYSAYIISTISQKGGVFKSTLSRTLAVEASKGGLSVLLADLDTQQGTSVKWAMRRLESEISPAINVQSFKTVKQALTEANKYDMLIIDAPARSSAGTLESALAADFVVHPTGVSLDDLEPAVLLFHELRKNGIPTSKMSFSLSHVLNEREEREAREYLTGAGYDVIAGYIEDKTSFKTALNQGRVLTEVSHPSLRKKADKVIQSLIDKVSNNG